MKTYARIVRPLGGLGVLLAGLTVSPGCTHNYYYGGACAPGGAAVVPGSVQYGSVCDVPTRVDGGVGFRGFAAVAKGVDLRVND